MANMTYSCEIDDKLKIVPLLFLFVFAPTNSLSQALSFLLWCFTGPHGQRMMLFYVRKESCVSNIFASQPQLLQAFFHPV